MVRGNSMRPDRTFLRTGLAPALVPGALAFAVFVVFATKDAGYPPTVWYPGAAFLVALLAVSAWAGPVFGRPSRPALVSIVLLAGLTAWTYLSIAWSDVKGDAWDGANRGLLYLVVYVLCVGLALRAESVVLILAGYALSIAVVGLVEFVAASRSADPDSYFLLARFAEPTGYQNANCALFSIAFWPAVLLASRRQLPIVLRALLLSAAGVLVELALLSQSRGWLAAMPIVLLVSLAVVPNRVRTLAFLLPVALALLITRGPLLDVFPSLQSGEGIHAALRSARSAIVLTGLALLLVGAALAAADRYLWPEGDLGRRLVRAAAVVFAVAAVTGGVIGLVWLGNPSTRVRNAWDDFRGKAPAQPTASYLTSGFGSNRYDLWRVALGEVSDHPLTGVGSDNFAVDYLRERRSDEEPLYPHSLELKILAQTGVVGGLLFSGLLVAALIAWGRRRDESELSRVVRAAALVGFAYWLVHGSVDWFWELAGLGGPAFAMLGLAAARSGHVLAPGRRPSRIAQAAGAAALLAALVSLVLPWLSAKEVQAAAGEWRRAPERAFDRLDRARRLNPLSDQPDLIAGAVASQIGDTGRMITWFRRAVERNPTNWYSHLELGVAYARQGQRSRALGELAVARALDPREPTIRLVRSRVRQGLPVSTAELDRIFLSRNVVSNREGRK